MADREGAWEPEMTDNATRPPRRERRRPDALRRRIQSVLEAAPTLEAAIRNLSAEYPGMTTSEMADILDEAAAEAKQDLDRLREDLRQP